MISKESMPEHLELPKSDEQIHKESGDIIKQLKAKFRNRLLDPTIIDSLSKLGRIDIYQMAYWAGVDDAVDVSLDRIKGDE